MTHSQTIYTNFLGHPIWISWVTVVCSIQLPPMRFSQVAVWDRRLGSRGEFLCSATCGRIGVCHGLPISDQTVSWMSRHPGPGHMKNMKKNDNQVKLTNYLWDAPRKESEDI